VTKVVGEVAIDVTADIGPLVSAMKRGEAAMDGLRGAAASTSRSLEKISDVATSLGTGLTAVSGAIAGVVAAAFALAKGTADNAREIQKFAQISNAGTQEFQRMAAGARTVGIEHDKLADILKDVNDRIGDFVSTGGGPMADFFENVAPKVGVTADQFARLSGPEALQLYVDSLQKAGLSQQEMTFYLEAMASDTTALIPLLANGGAEMQRLGEAAASAGAIMDEKAIAASNEFNAALQRLGGAFQGLRDRFAVTLMPMMTRIMELVETKVVPAADMAIVKFGQFMDFMSGLPAPILEAVGVIGAALGVGGPILLGVGLVSKALGALIAATGPVGLFIAAATLIIAAWQVWGDDIIRIVGQVAEFITTAFNDAVTAVTNFGIAARDTVTGAVEWMQLKFTEFLTFVRALPAQLMEIGSQMIQGLIDGIWAKWEELKALIYGLGEMMPEWMREMLDIQSPSRVFYDIGSFVGQGLAQGIADSQAMVATAVDTLGKGAIASTSGMVSGVMGALGQLFQGSKKFAMAQALINAWTGASEALKLPFPANLGAFAKVLATGMNAVRNIRSAQPGASGAGAGSAGSAAASISARPASTSTAATPASPLDVRLTGISAGDLFSGAQLSGLLDRLSAEAGDRGYRLMVAQ
jgi:hypothetical protein